MKWKVITYTKENGESPVSEFLNKLSIKHRAKAIWEIELLVELGMNLREPYTKAIKDHNGLWELRIKFASDISRIFYFMPIGDTFILLHGFIKKTNKIPKNEIEKAVQYMDDYKRRFLNEE
jgi:phage-related protein